MSINGNSTPTYEGRRVLIFDDGSKYFRTITKCAEKANFDVHVFETREELEISLMEQKADLIILDLFVDGIDVVEVMKSLDRFVFGGAILLVSDQDLVILEEVHSLGEDLGLTMSPVLQKPFRIEDLRVRLNAVPKLVTPRAEDIDFEAAIQNNWLELWYQPKIDLESLLVCGAEASVRVRHPKYGIIQPSQLLPSPGDPLYEPLSDFIVRRSLADWSYFSENKITIPLAINVSISLLQSPEFVDNIRRHIPTDDDFSGLIVEITEDEAIDDTELAKQIAVQLKLYNIRVAIDHFGVGHTSLSTLDQLPFDELKLDRKFVDGCSEDEGKRAICEKVALLADHFDLVTVAEGVENEDDLKVLMEQGYDIAQGVLFAEPIDREGFVDLIYSRAGKRPKTSSDDAASTSADGAIPDSEVLELTSPLSAHRSSGVSAVARDKR